MSEPKTLLIPEGALDEPAQPPKPKAPTCPACGAKFSHSIPKQMCKICGLPDEVAMHGQEIVDRWKKQNHIGRMLRKRRAEQQADKPKFGGSAGRKKNKPGRKGVKA